MEESVTDGDNSFKARFVALGINFSRSAHSLTSIRDRLNEGSAGIVSNRTVKQLIIEMYGDAVCFTYLSNKRISQMVWNTTKERADTIQAAFQVYLKERASRSQSFDYWNTYVSDLYPIVRDLTNSLRSGDWILYLSAMERATSLFFFFGRTNYCRWTPLFLQDCYQLKDKFPLL
ncbi:hypothetical protein CesoFtcFv8_015001 [Champsocephalus esox]|uniref:Uncharacterized protein n=1 Tax=Champsocephalus esox TaxID=159716 RepID=A0AAN8GSH7_9TELE|nr:hypothetical protein CesoFtcFv8_015001 [Champsocephalus esox]